MKNPFLLGAASGVVVAGLCLVGFMWGNAGAQTIPPDPRANFTYLPESSTVAAQARSHQEAVAMGWTGTAPGAPEGFQWWDWRVYPCTVGGNSSFIQIEDVARLDGTDFTANPGNHDGLTDAEKSTLIPFSTMQAAGCFPAPVIGASP